ncbi:MAG: 5-(carboxyamino)imidazole ribonucleotide synthase [Saprospiraceae bacterium]|jgi:5-(carboxyamino)imidazole ribonucleotide synthase
MNKSIGILGGGQLGMMLYKAGIQYDIDLHFLDNIKEGPVSAVTDNYSIGDITDEKDVLKFGQAHEVISIEIERVNVAALKQLSEEGIKVFPQPEIVEIIQDKGLQKQFYNDNNLPTSDFKIYDNISSLVFDLDGKKVEFPIVQKMRKDGYDGRGVQILRSEADLDKAFPYNFISETCIDIEKELAVITCTDINGNIVMYDPVEMVFHPEMNILLYQLAPASISKAVLHDVQEIAMRTTKAFGIVGLLAIELFLTKSGEILINEVAPRPHNSGHHTIEASSTSQYENQIRAISGMPLGETKTRAPSLLMNVLGAEGYTGPVVYEGVEEVESLDGVHLHIYGKTSTKPFRKMGHINILSEDPQELIEKYNNIQKTLRVIAKK